MISILTAELKKVIRLSFIFIVTISALVMELVFGLMPKFHDYPYSVEVYRKYTEQYEGLLTDEKAERLNARLEEINELIALHDIMENDYLNGRITLEVFSAYTEKYDIASTEVQTVEYLCKKVELMLTLTDFEKEIFYDTDWQTFFKDNGYNFILLIAILCIAVPVFDIEYSSGSHALLLTSKRGKAHLAAAKLITVAGTVFVLSVLMSAVRFGIFAYNSGLDFCDKAIGNILLTDGYKTTSLLDYFIADTFMKATGYTMYAMIACLITVLCKNTTFSFILSFLAMIAPLFISNVITGAAAPYIITAKSLETMYPPTTQPVLVMAAAIIKSLIFGAATTFLWGKRRARMG